MWRGFRVRRCAAKIAIAPDGEVVGEVADVLAGGGGEQRGVFKIVARAEDERTVAAEGRGSGALVGEDIIDIAVAAVDPVVAGFASIGVAEELQRDGAQKGFVLELVEFVAQHIEIAADDDRLAGRVARNARGKIADLTELLPFRGSLFRLPAKLGMSGDHVIALPAFFDRR